MIVMNVAALFLALATTVCAYPGVPSKIGELIDKWAPLVKLAQNEPWKPSSVDYFLSHCKLKGCTSGLTSSSLERCDSKSFIVTKDEISCPSCTEPAVLRGQDPSSPNNAVPTYVIYREHNNFLEIAYWMFFPYNRGKRVCVGLYSGCPPCKKVWGKCPCPSGCIGGYSTFGHHVGDWEKVYVRFRKVNTDYQIYSIYLSMHGSAVTQKFGGEFLWQGGQFKKGDKTLGMYGGTHAIVYCAAGSHGMWPDTGRHVYMTLPNKDTLIDEASSGTSWYTWKNLKPVQYDSTGQYSGEFKFLGFQGRWGNKKEGCDVLNFDVLEDLFGECQLNNGPKGPSRWPEV